MSNALKCTRDGCKLKVCILKLFLVVCKHVHAMCESLDGVIHRFDAFVEGMNGEGCSVGRVRRDVGSQISLSWSRGIRGKSGRWHHLGCGRERPSWEVGLKESMDGGRVLRV